MAEATGSTPAATSGSWIATWNSEDLSELDKWTAPGEVDENGWGISTATETAVMPAGPPDDTALPSLLTYVSRPVALTAANPHRKRCCVGAGSDEDAVKALEAATPLTPDGELRKWIAREGTGPVVSPSSKVVGT